MNYSPMHSSAACVFAHSLEELPQRSSIGRAPFYACACTRAGILRSTTTHKSSPNRPAPSLVIRFCSCSDESNRRRQTAWRLPASVMVSISSWDTDPNSAQSVRSAESRLPTSPHCTRSFNALFMALLPPIPSVRLTRAPCTARCGGRFSDRAGHATRLRSAKSWPDHSGRHANCRSAAATCPCDTAQKEYY